MCRENFFPKKQKTEQQNGNHAVSIKNCFTVGFIFGIHRPILEKNQPFLQSLTMKTVFSTLCRLRRQATHVTAVAVALCSLSARAQTLYWDPDLTAAGNDALTGAGLGGSGSWNTSVANWWDTAAMTAWANSGAEQALFSGLYTPGVLTAQNVSLTGSINANQLQFWRSGYTLSGGTLNLTGTNPALFAATGEYADIQSQIGGTAGLSMTGGGVIRLADGNTYAGTTTIADGALIISSATGLGTDTSAVVVTGFNTAVGSTNLKSYNGGTLVLDGTSGGFTFGRDLSLQGQGGIAPYGAALVSTGVNTLSGTVTMGNPYGTTFLNTRMIAADGTLNISNGLVVQGAATTTISSLGGTNQAGASFYNVLGTLSGTGTLEASGGGTLFLNPSDSSGFSGTVRVSASAASGQSVVRIDSPNVLGTRTATGTSSVIDMNGGVLAVLMDNPSVTVAGGSAANVYGRTSSTFFADHTPNSSVKDQTVTFGQLAFEDNLTITFNSRNGYGMTFGAAPVVGSVAGDNNSTFTNNLQGGAQLTFVGNFWSNTNNGAARTMTIGGNGNTTINGNIIASSAAYDHILTKTGTGTLTLLGTASTLDGAVNVNGGTVAINDWRAITNNTSAVNIGTGGTSATLAVVGNNVNQTNLTTSKVINLAGTTGGATILANQTGTSPGIIINSDLTATGGGSKTLTLAGTNLASNTINGVIPDNSATNKTSLLKYGPGTWVLAGSNTYTGTTTIADGTLRVLANGPTSTVIADASSLVFNASNVYAGGTLEFLGQASANNVETLGSLVPTNGSGTVKLVPGSGGTASLVFSSLGTVGSGGTANLVAPTANDTFSFTTAPVTGNIANAGLYYNGSDFAFIPGAGLAVRAPNYATDPDFATSATALTAGSSNEITGSFTTPGAVAIDSLKIDGSQTLTLGGNLTIRTAAGSTASGGILQTGGIGTITGNFGVGTLGSGTTVIRVDQATDELTIESNMSGAGGITKSGAGMLRLAGTNTQTGTISINEGTIRLASGGSLGGLAALTIRQDAALELNGVTPSNSIAAYNNNGTIRNTSATTDVTLTVGGSNGTGTSYGIVEDGGLAKINLVKIGTGNQSWLGLSTYTGTTTIGSTGIVSINNLQNGGDASGIGASSNAASNLIFNGTS
ncbi:MAG: autotransporter-associated beta strand repeat-containing protein, partial [Verrucomicrobiales bacterium]|nr:autotransporter-associated beta strand repeat-containing protein [Verrucomicrobiales bacterium]